MRILGGILNIIIDAPIIIAPHVNIDTDNPPMITTKEAPNIELIDGKNAKCHTGKIIPEIKIIIPAASDKPKNTDTSDFSFITDISIFNLHPQKITNKLTHNFQT